MRLGFTTLTTLEMPCLALERRNLSGFSALAGAAVKEPIASTKAIRSGEADKEKQQEVFMVG